MKTSANPSAVQQLVGPWQDLLLLGGGSVIALGVLQLWQLDSTQLLTLGAVMLILANWVNHPHFAYSYQMFYGAWSDLGHAEFPRSLRWRWWLAGVFAPIALAAVLAWGAWRWSHGEGLMLGVALTVMGALVGWHYVKQGFGMAMMDAALKKRFWSTRARRALLVNAYASWAVAWALLNVSSLGRSFWGVVGVPVPVPVAAVVIAGLIAGCTTCWMALECLRCVRVWRKAGATWREWPLAGWLAYLVTLYLWTIFSGMNPAFLLVIPFFHSLQYLTVVWRFKSSELAQAREPQKKLMRFALHGFCWGALGFWILPMGLDYLRTGQLPQFTGDVAVAVACFWIFINIHHYLIDNVIWRQGNPRVRRYLFEAKPTATAA